MQEIRCPKCGGNQYSNLENGLKKCLYCGNEFFESQHDCCGNNQQQRSASSSDAFANGPSGKSRGVAGLLAIFLGSLGIQYFYIGKTSAGVICLCATIFTCGIAATVISILTLIQGVMMLTMTEETFESKYINNTSTFPLF